MSLLADRFLRVGASWVDIASGAAVRIRLNRTPPGSDVFVWNDRCATLARLRHPLLNELVDFGQVDASRTFEAYAAGEAAETSARRGARLLTHVVAFLEAQGVGLDAASAQLAFRPVHAMRRPESRRAFGLVLQPRRAYFALDDLLQEAAAGGVLRVHVSGEHGAGLRTLRWHAARAARLCGFTPVAASVLRSIPWLTRDLRDRHVCVLLDSSNVSSDAGSFIGELGLQSSRRHLLIRFTRDPDGPHSLVLDRMGVTAMISMLYCTAESGVDAAAVSRAARRADGNPGRFLAELHAAAFPDHRSTIAMVHESSPAYVIPQMAETGPQRSSGTPRSLATAEERAARLAARGRHASASRLLTRASRVFELRGDRTSAAWCAIQLGWILRDRARTEAALEQAMRARALVPDGPTGLAANVSIGVLWTDSCRLADAEAALRASLVAAELVGDGDLEEEARVALGRCLYWQKRYDEALTTVAAATQSRRMDWRIAALALAARIHVAGGRYQQAGAQASEAMQLSAGRNGRTRAVAARAMAVVHAAIADKHALQASVDAGLAAACAAHTPLVALRLRAILLTAIRRDDPHESRRLEQRIRTALNRGGIPPLLKLQLEAAVNATEDQTAAPDPLSHATINGLQDFLELAFGATDDGTATEAICKALCDRLRAATVQIVSADKDQRLLARAGRPWVGDLRIVSRALAACMACRPSAGEQKEVAHPIRYGGQTVGVLACRWTCAAEPNIEAAVALLKAGALAIAPTVRALLDRSQRPVHDAVWRDLIGTGPPLASLRDAIARAARAPFPVLVEGESGSGKELVARAIHRLSGRRDRRLCAVNCAAISDDLLEAELFGHARGAFTGAIGERAGLFEESDGGTLFLDEVAELSARGQAKLLRTLQDGEVRRVGENFARRVDVRIVAATNRRLDEEVEAGRFRADLRFRLDVIRIHVPPLRERVMDIPLLAAHFWDEATRRVESTASLSPETVAALTRYEWPGNVRQLQNVIASLAVNAPRRGRVPPSLLPVHIARSAAPAAGTFDAAREDFERRFVSAALARAGGHRAKAARALGITRQGLAKMMRRLRIEC